MFKGTVQLTVFQLRKNWTETTSFPSPFLTSIALVFVSTKLFRNSSLFACSTACASAAERMKRVNTGLFRK